MIGNSLINDCMKEDDRKTIDYIPLVGVRGTWTGLRTVGGTTGFIGGLRALAIISLATGNRKGYRGNVYTKG